MRAGLSALLGAFQLAARRDAGLRQVLDPGGVVDRALAAIRCPAKRISDGVPTFDNMKKEDAKLVRRGKPGSWRDEFPPELLPLFWKRNGDAMRRFGYIDGEMPAAA